MDWSNSMSLQLIGYYKANECIWNPSHNYYKNKMKRLEAWENISKMLNCNVNDVKKKMESLLTSYRRERLKQESSKKSGCSLSDAYESNWFGFNSMEFLNDKCAQTQTRKTEKPNTKKQTEVKVQHTIVESDDMNTEINNTNNIDNAAIIMNKHLISSKRLTTIQDCLPDKAYKNLKETHETRLSRDESSIYGEYIAFKHRKYSSRTKCMVEHLIAKILFNADMDRYDVSTTPNSYNYSLSSPNTPPYHEQPSTSQENPHFQQPKSVENTTPS